MTGQVAGQGLDASTPAGAAALETHIQSRLSGRLSCFRLVVVGQGLILRGHTRTYYVKQLAQHEVMTATALPILANEIEVS
jgi:hypothetical protein